MSRSTVPTTMFRSLLKRTPVMLNAGVVVWTQLDLIIGTHARAQSKSSMPRSPSKIKIGLDLDSTTKVLELLEFCLIFIIVILYIVLDNVPVTCTNIVVPVTTPAPSNEPVVSLSKT